ncbi:hypothetical protein H5410_045082 [Solanum commersonii]|uniref:Uncharacterized protein n=1 Tax=Solanum commersonii TaxID=4109 RepID=A0A9J5XCP1_SOLCO|nr:hypothetical protein H5410_045082 [Solanum commersonii]
MDAQSPSKRLTRDWRKLVQNRSNLTSELWREARKISLMLGQVKKRKEKTTNYAGDNAKRNEVVVSGSLEHDELCIVTMFNIQTKCIK